MSGNLTHGPPDPDASAIERLCREVWRAAPWLSGMVTSARSEHTAMLNLIRVLEKARPVQASFVDERETEDSG